MFYIGLDLGQRQDHTAIVVVEKEKPGREFGSFRFFDLTYQLVRHAERVALGTPYPAVVKRVREITRDRQLAGRCTVIADGTGVGAPVVDMLRGAGLGCEVARLLITGGQTASRGQEMGGTLWHVPKQELLMRVQVLLEQGELKIAADLQERGALVRELKGMRMAMDGRGMKAGAAAGEHDDLVMALALACWGAERPEAGFRGRFLV
jgi:hypothetical protein